MEDEMGNVGNEWFEKLKKPFEIDKKCEQEVVKANQFAISSKYPNINDLSAYVFKE